MDNNAIVIGAGIGGLTAASVLSRRYSHVTLLDRDTLPPGATPRRGVPQGHQPHLLLVGGVRALAALFPGFEEEILAAGGVRVDTGSDLCTYRLGRRWPAAPTGLETVSATRPQIEATIRGRVAALDNVTIRDQTAASGLTGRDGVVTGVVLDNGETLDAALVVDSTGRGSRSDRWLGALGLPSPEQVEVRVNISYTTRIYRRCPGDLADGWSAAVVLPTAPHQKMSGLALPVEGDRWLVAAGGWHLPEPPADVPSFEACLRALPDPIMADLIAKAEPISDVTMARFPSSRRRLFEKLDRLPSGYLAVGDAICSFNPIYGQGMTCAARQATALGDELDRHGTPDSDMARAYYRTAAEIIKAPWQFAVGGDLSFPETVGPRSRTQAITGWYSRQLAYASQIDAGIYEVFQQVQHLVEPPSVLFRPGFAARVLRQARIRKREDAVRG